MQVRRRKSNHWVDTLRERASDAHGLDSVVESAAQKVGALTSELAERASDVGDQIADMAGEAAHKVMDKAKSTPTATKHRRHPLRKFLLIFGPGALAAYFLDRQNGRQRREHLRSRASESARHLGDGLERAAKVAHEAADVSAPEEPADVLTHRS